LEGLRESGELQRVAVRPLPFRVGRSYESDLRLESQHGSQNHAEFFYRDGGLWLRDLGSTNGTAVNGRRIHREEAIQNGDMVHFADQEYRIRAEVAPNSPLQTQVFSQTQRRRLESLVRKPLAFREMLERDLLRTDFQPLVHFSNGQTFGYEVLGRGDLDGSKTSPADLFFIAEKLHEEIPLSVAFRAKGLELGHDLPGDPTLFVNTHPAELGDTHALLGTLEDLREAYPKSRIALEIHEAAIADIAALKTLRAAIPSGAPTSGCPPLRMQSANSSSSSWTAVVKGRGSSTGRRTWTSWSEG
jgi:pSer/pThr/pTyr-binding forkhead associated (FHA) protein